MHLFTHHQSSWHSHFTHGGTEAEGCPPLPAPELGGEARYSPTQWSLCTWKPGGQMQRKEPSRFWQVPGRQVPGRLRHSLVSVERRRRGLSTSWGGRDSPGAETSSYGHSIMAEGPQTSLPGSRGRAEPWENKDIWRRIFWVLVGVINGARCFPGKGGVKFLISSHLQTPFMLSLSSTQLLYYFMHHKTWIFKTVIL